MLGVWDSVCEPWPGAVWRVEAWGVSGFKVCVLLSPDRVLKLSWLKRRPDVPRLWVQSPVRTYTRNNQ